MWSYSQSTGNLLLGTVIVSKGYSGHGEGRNNPAMQNVHETGPIPQGLYQIGPPVNLKKEGPFVLQIVPENKLMTFGRGEFLMHGDGVKTDASMGCIVMDRPTRERIWNSGDHRLTVIV